jgi:hypothetical protein
MTNPLARHGHVSYLEIPAVDPARSAAFYEAVFGWNIRARDSKSPSFDDPAGSLIGRWNPNRAISRDAGVLPYIYVEHIDEVVQQIAKHGGQIVKAVYPEGDVRVATFHDPAGNLIGVWEFATH